VFWCKLCGTGAQQPPLIWPAECVGYTRCGELAGLVIHGTDQIADHKLLNRPIPCWCRDHRAGWVAFIQYHTIPYSGDQHVAQCFAPGGLIVDHHEQGVFAPGPLQGLR